MKIKIFKVCVMLVILTSISCNQDSNTELPTYSDISISPVKDTYQVGDIITCKINLLTEGGEDLIETKYWWYTSWWFTDPNFTADFQAFDENENTSSEIVLTHAGKQKLYFFGQLKYPEWNWIKIEIPVEITVEE